ncbi:MAG: CBS domain-containing protein [Planctomycetes bacterium]|nr:CBS domain-containing protein [Planctomycetota bacterium]
MKGSFKLGRFLGIEVNVHITFAIFFVAAALWGAWRGETAQLGQVLTFIGGVFLLSILHESAHALAAAGFGIQTKEMLLLPFAGVSRLERRPADPFHAFVIAIAGPAANLLLAVTLFGILLFLGADPFGLGATVFQDCLYWLNFSFTPGGSPSGAPTEILELSLLLGLGNLFPSYPMDGGPALRALLSSMVEPTRAIKLTGTISSFLSFAVILICLLAGNWLLAILGLFIHMSGRQESARVAARNMIEGLHVRAAMTTQYITLATYETLETAARTLVRSTQHDFPVVGEDGRFLAMLTRQDLLRELRARGPMSRVIEAARRGLQTLSPDQKLDDLFDQWSGFPPVSFPVLEEGKLVGLLNADGIQKCLLVRDVESNGA